LEDRKTLESYNIKPKSTIHVSHKLLGGSSVAYFVISSSFLKPKFDIDYTNGTDNGTHIRGPERYHLPIGWKKVSLNVDRYGGGTWLDMDRKAWPVSYHGTDQVAASHISTGGYDLNKGKRFAFGRGIYSSPYFLEAEAYATTFSFENGTYKVMFQNRVNPADLHKVNSDKYWVTKNQQNIRPYSLCIKRIS